MRNKYCLRFKEGAGEGCNGRSLLISLYMGRKEANRIGLLSATSYITGTIIGSGFSIQNTLEDTLSRYLCSPKRNSLLCRLHRPLSHYLGSLCPVGHVDCHCNPRLLFFPYHFRTMSSWGPVFPSQEQSWPTSPSWVGIPSPSPFSGSPP